MLSKRVRGHPALESVQAWALAYVQSESLAYKLAPPPPPPHWAAGEAAPSPLRLSVPGRPPELQVELKGHRTPGVKALRVPRERAQLLHTFLHHELQAAELMCAAVLAFPHTPLAFRKGLIAICLDELRHMQMYAEHMAKLGEGFRFGDFAVNDWFWRKLPGDATPLQFVALMGLGFEGGNLDHTQRFATRFRKAGDEAGALIQEQIGAEEIPHVAFAAHWFARFCDAPLSFETWSAALPPPLSPLLMRGRPLNRAARAKAGFSEAFMDALAGYESTALPPGKS